jgi:glycosyltransferase involved in cell wall biosynthesis
LQLQDIVVIDAPVTIGLLPERYRRATVHVNLTPVGFSDKVAWEAMSCATPCLVANEGLGDTLGIYKEPLTFPFGDDERLAERLAWLLALPVEARRQIGAYLREQVVSLHSIDRLADRLIALTVESGGGRRAASDPGLGVEGETC